MPAAEAPTLMEAGVSVREAEVLELLGEHLTNAEISARLYISVRTVESHVSSLLRKLGVADRRALGQFATALAAEPATATGDEPGASSTTPAAPTTSAAPVAPPLLPATLTSFVGRAAERAGLAEALRGRRLVTAVGPGGVGKTRLALAVAVDVADRYEDGVWYVDLVPVTDPDMVPAAVAAALGVSAQSARTIEETVLARLARAETLVVLDNCEHLVESVVVFVERLLAACPRTTVLATSRARLLVPFESVFPVEGLSVEGMAAPEVSAAEASTDEVSAEGVSVAGAAATGNADPQAWGDAVALFVDRAAAVGAAPTTPDDLQRIATICAQLDGLALAIELAAARLPTLGLDGLEASLSDQLGVLAGRRRVDDRHSSLRAALDWSYALLTPAEQAILRRVSVFAAPFRVDDATEVVAFAPIGEAEIAVGLAHLADQSLLVVSSDGTGTRYRALETIRQYGVAAQREAGEHDVVQDHHLRWSTTQAGALHDELSRHSPAELPVSWRLGFDLVADDLRAALRWAAAQPDRRADAHRLAVVLAELAFGRGLSDEAQRRFEDAARLASGQQATTALRNAVGVAKVRQLGDDCLRLQQARAQLALDDGDAATAAAARAEAAELIGRCPGILREVPSQAETDALRAEAHRLAVSSPGDPQLDSLLLVAEAFNTPELDPLMAMITDRAVDLARRAGEPHLLSAALDALTAVRLASGDQIGAAETARQRADMLYPLPVTPATAFELTDSLQMASETSTAIGDLVSARRFAEQLRALPFFGEDAHLTVSRLLVVESLTGNWDRALGLSVPFRERWERVGAPPTSNLAMGASAIKMIHGLRGDHAAQEEWQAIVEALGAALTRRYGREARSNPAFDAVVDLHRGDAEGALATLAHPPESFREWHTGRMRQWYAGLWAEAAVLAEHPSATERLGRARYIARGNPIATALVDRATVLVEGTDRAALLPIADRLDAADCRYQAARTRVLAGGAARDAGQAALAEMGATPMPVP